jgi:hypothetical protein
MLYGRDKPVRRAAGENVKFEKCNIWPALICFNTLPYHYILMR